jgi:predicted glycosyl hydrolase (DUF1957 family)
MMPFRSEIRNSPTRPTIKIFLSDETLDEKVKTYLEHFDAIEMMELRESVGQNRVNENITVFIKEGADIREVKAAIDTDLQAYFEKGLVD